MTLSELDILEKEIFVRLAELNRQRVESEILENYLLNAFSKYTAIHKAYIDLIKNGDEPTKTEALKRALYLQWISSFEPSFLTGTITSFVTFENSDVGLELKDFQFVYSYLNDIIKNNKLDDELKEMLSYYSNWEFVFEFENFKDYKHLHNFVIKIADTNTSYIPLIKKRKLADRGQMGDYFLGLGTLT